MSKKSISIEDIWPQERDCISRPERFKYVRKLIKPDGCVFCKEAQLGPTGSGLCLYKHEQAMVVLNKYPYNTGHLLVLPVRHVGKIWDLKSEEYQQLSQLLLKSAEVLEQVYQPQGLNIGMNHGQVAGAGIPEHLHWHIIPRWSGDTNFFPLIAETKVHPESLEQSYSKLKPEFDKLEF
ncbi:MAG: HIT domain-containing protein [Bdellovibrionales bacterium]|nr:HIT domain-containing protein [Bdellovibrionales bacterium]